MRLSRGALARTGLAAIALMAVGTVALMHPRASRADSLPCQAPNRGFDFDTFELENYQQQYAQAIELAAAGKAAIPAFTLGSTGETVDFTYQGLESRPSLRTPSREPGHPHPTDHLQGHHLDRVALGRRLVDGALWRRRATAGFERLRLRARPGDSGMGEFGSDAYAPGVPSARQGLIGTDFLFNLAEGARILADKWNQAPATRPIAGTGDPAMLKTGTSRSGATTVSP